MLSQAKLIYPAAVMPADLDVVRLVPLVMLIAGHWRMVVGFLAAAGVELTFSILGAGVHSPLAWLHAVTAADNSPGTARVSTALAALTSHRVTPLLISCLLVAGVAVAIWRPQPSPHDPGVALGLGLVARQFASPHLRDGDSMMLGIAFIILLSQRLPSLLLCVAALNAGYLGNSAVPAS